jgi:hypothetical protein
MLSPKKPIIKLKSNDTIKTEISSNSDNLGSGLSSGVAATPTFKTLNSNNTISSIANNTTNININLNNNIPIDIYLEEIDEPINIQNLNRPFSIMLKQLELNKLYNSAFEEKKAFQSFVIKIQIYCGSDTFSNSRLIKWRGSPTDTNPLINRRIYFSVQYQSLPMFSSIVFKVKHLKFNKNNELMKHHTIAWANFRLFDHNRRLKTGKIN